MVFAQATITGTVRDSSGGVLPGVTVEATSPVLIEKVRTAVTDGTGQYRIIELGPGTYTVTYTLPGFNRVVRDNVEVSGTAVVTINADMRVGALEETITVTSETPVVDLQSVRRETVISSEVIESIPATRAVGSLLNATPGLTVDNNGMAPTPTMTFFSARGGQTNEGRMTVNGMPVAATFNGGGVSSYIYDSVNADEVSVTVSGNLGETDVGGPVMNLVPRAGGNSFRGEAFYNGSGDALRGNNLTDELMALPPGPNLRETPGIINSWDASVSYGGPIKRDRFWFFGSYRNLKTATAREGIVANANAFDFSHWDWAPDDSLTARRIEGRSMIIGRFTAQATEKNRFSFNHEYQLRCEGSPLKTETTTGCNTRGDDWIALGASGFVSSSPEADTGYFDLPYYVTQALWTAPMTNKLLLEAGYTRFSYYHAGGPGQLPPDGVFDQISVSEQSTAVNPATGLQYAPRANYNYRALATYNDNYGKSDLWRASASYVTGAHNMKIGYQGAFLLNDTTAVIPDSQISYRFNQGNPNAFTMRLPTWNQAERTQTASIFIQDAWTRGRLTLQGALRYDRAWSYAPAEHNGTELTSKFNAAPISFPRTTGVDAFNDITPRIGVAYDVFGNGKTALKFNWGHYLDAATNDSAYTRNSPAQNTVRTVTNRGWTDWDGDKVIDCNPMNFGAQVGAPGTGLDTCAALTGNNLNFGNANPNVTQVNQDTLRGWGVRENDWQWGLTVQQEIVPRVSIDVGYNRRWWHGFTVTDNTVRTPDEYDAWTINAPVDARLPDGGGYPITMYTVKAAAAAEPARNYITFETDFGDERTNYWHGVDVNVSARLRNGLFISAGTSTGREIENDCATAVKIDSPDDRTCNSIEPFQTTVRGLATYTIPKIDVLVSGTIRSQPPLGRVATWNVPNTLVSQPQYLGRVPPGSTLNGNTAVALFDENEYRLYADERRTQLDLRIAKILRFGPTRADVGVDIGNVFNTNYATAFENTYQYSVGNTAMGGTWNNPTSVYTPRYFRINTTVSF
jgi:hypothetical protein